MEWNYDAGPKSRVIRLYQGNHHIEANECVHITTGREGVLDYEMLSLIQILNSREEDLASIKSISILGYSKHTETVIKACSRMKNFRFLCYTEGVENMAALPKTLHSLEVYGSASKTIGNIPYIKRLTVNGVHQRLTDKFAEAVIASTTLKALSIECSAYDENLLKLVAKSSLEELGIEHRPLTLRQVEGLFVAVCENSSMKVLIIRGTLTDHSVGTFPRLLHMLLSRSSIRVFQMDAALQKDDVKTCARLLEAYGGGGRGVGLGECNMMTCHQKRARIITPLLALYGNVPRSSPLWKFRNGDGDRALSHRIAAFI